MLTGDEIHGWEYWSEEEPEFRDHMTVTEMVQEFAKVTGQKAPYRTYLRLIEEEFDEFIAEDEYTVGELKELADLVYVIYGYANVIGYDLETAVRRVHESNITRVIHDDGKVHFREDGKAIKNPNAKKVDLNDLI